MHVPSDTHIHTVIGFAFARPHRTRHRPFTRSHVNYYFFIPDLSRVACNLTISREGDTYTRGDSIVMDRERNFSRDGRTDGWTSDKKNLHFQLFFEKGREKKEIIIVALSGRISTSREICAICCWEKFSIGGYLPCAVLRRMSGR